MSKPFIKYFDTGSWPVAIGFTSDEAAFFKEMKRIKLEDRIEFVVSGKGASTHILTTDGTRVIIITLKRKTCPNRASEAALVAHEAFHAWEWVCEKMGNEHPRGEHAAYAIQWITYNILEELWGKK